MEGMINSANEFLKNDKSGLGDAINNAGGGGEAGERKEDYLDKAVDYAQQAMGQGDQSNETAVDQQTDNVIADQIRSNYKKFAGSDFPIKDGQGAQEQ